MLHSQFIHHFIRSATFVLLTLGAAPSAHSEATAVARGEILWDRFGVPHIYAKSEQALFYGFGWAQAKSHGDVLLRLYGEARGRAAEYWGKKHVESDRWVLMNDVYERAGRWYLRQTSAFRADLDAFARGVNDYAARHRDEFDPAVLRALPITGRDVVAHAHRLMNYAYIASPQKVLGEPLQTAATDDGPAGGSNAWAVAPSRSASGKTLLLANPHLPWELGALTYYEAQLVGPGYEAYGATQIGLPVLRFAFNRDHGFTNTVNTIAGATVYKLTLKDDGYVLDGGVKPFFKSTKTLRIREPDGSLRKEELIVRSTRHGPVFERKNGDTVALRVAGLDRPRALQQYFDMARAGDFAAFQKIMRRLQLPMFNIVYGDRRGHIFYLDNGILPKRAFGDFAFWNGVAPGDQSAAIWNDIHAYDDLPKLADPKSGFVQNANDPPWAPTLPGGLDPKAFPPYVAPPGPLSLRAQRSIRLLRDEPKIGFDDFVRLKLDTRSLMADRLLPPLIAAAAESPDPEIKAAAALLEEWDHRFEADSRAALLFETWARLFSPGNFTSQDNYAAKWSPGDPVDTPSGLEDPAGAVRLLAQAAAETKTRYGALDRPFGDVSRFHLGDVDLPGHGGFGNLGIFRVMTWSAPKDGVRTPVHGETFVSLVEFSDPIRAVGLMSYGNASQKGTRHRSDQLPFLAAKRFRTLWTTRAEVEHNLEERTRF